MVAYSPGIQYAFMHDSSEIILIITVVEIILGIRRSE